MNKNVYFKNKIDAYFALNGYFLSLYFICKKLLRGASSFAPA